MQDLMPFLVKIRYWDKEEFFEHYKICIAVDLEHCDFKCKELVKQYVDATYYIMETF